jgi:hypothetical protein
VVIGSGSSNEGAYVSLKAFTEYIEEPLLLPSVFWLWLLLLYHIIKIGTSKETFDFFFPLLKMSHHFLAH